MPMMAMNMNDYYDYDPIPWPMMNESESTKVVCKHTHLKGCGLNCTKSRLLTDNIIWFGENQFFSRSFETTRFFNFMWSVKRTFQFQKLLSYLLSTLTNRKQRVVVLDVEISSQGDVWKCYWPRTGTGQGTAGSEIFYVRTGTRQWSMLK